MATGFSWSLKYDFLENYKLEQEYATKHLQKNVEFKCKIHDRSYSCNYVLHLNAHKGL